MMEPARLLFVDDETRLLAAVQRTLHDAYDVTTAESGADGLAVLSADGPFAVVISDMRMPRMDGATFLARARDLAPDTTRVLLTGMADLDSAVAAVNRGGIFRFLTKPCPNELLRAALDEAIELHRLKLSERELLEQTLAGAVKLVTDLLSLTAPALFSHANRIRGCVTHMVARLGVPDPWQYEVAALLSQIGCVALPEELLERARAGQPIPEQGRRQFQDHPAVGHRLLAPIPRLDKVAEMVRDQRLVADGPATTPAALGAVLLRLATALDGLLARGVALPEALRELATRKHEPAHLAALADYAPPEHDATRSVTVAELRAGMVLEDDVCTRTGTVIVGRDQRVTAALLERVRRFAGQLVEPIRVRGATRAP